MTTPIERVAQEARQLGRRRLPRTNPYRVSDRPQARAERQLMAAVSELVAALEAAALRALPPEQGDARQDAAPDFRRVLQSTTDQYTRRAGRAVNPLIEEAEQAQLYAEQRALSPLGIDVIGSEPWLSSLLDARAKDFARLITRMGADVMQRVSVATQEALAKGRPRAWLQAQIREAGGIGKRRARLIARDQLGKLQGALHEARQSDAGLSSYIWRSSRDERVAGNPGGLYPDPDESSTKHGDHHSREGRRFLWAKKGSSLVELLPDGSTQVSECVDGHPGEPIQCRCWAEPVIPGLEDLAGAGRKSRVATGYRRR